MAEERKVDRRIQRTRTLLRDALMRLIIKRGYDEITIQDIADEANIARTTFYLHFSDKDDLLFSTMRDMYEELYARAEGVAASTIFSDQEDDCHAEDFLHMQEFAEFYRIMLSERGSAAFLTRVRQYLADSMLERTFSQLMPEGEEPRIPLEIIGMIKLFENIFKSEESYAVKAESLRSIGKCGGKQQLPFLKAAQSEKSYRDVVGKAATEAIALITKK